MNHKTTSGDSPKIRIVFSNVKRISSQLLFSMLLPRPKFYLLPRRKQDEHNTRINQPRPGGIIVPYLCT